MVAIDAAANTFATANQDSFVQGVEFNGEFDPTADVLTFTDQNGISGSYEQVGIQHARGVGEN